ncbi:MAG: hypothetical protein WCK15_01905 [Pirellula sp.]
MQNKKPSGDSAAKKVALQSNRRCEPLVTRLDPMTRDKQESTDPKCVIPAIGNDFAMTFQSPLFTRLLFDSTLTPVARTQFTTAMNPFGLGWIGPRSNESTPTTHVHSDSEHDTSPKRIAPLQFDEPIDVEAFEGAAAVEFQLYGLPFRSLPSSRRAKWTPSLPIEIFEFEQLAKKVECVRILTRGRCVVGAAISPGSMYEDVRYMADSGFDYLCLLVDVQCDLSPTGSRQLATIQNNVELALDAINNAGSKMKILLSANLRNADEMFRYLQMGVAAVSIDGYLASEKPIETAQAKDSYSSILSYSPPAGSAFAWVGQAVSSLVMELSDCAIYAGQSSDLLRTQMT